MSSGPKDTEDKLNRFVDGWTTHAPDKTFGGMTLTQFKAEIEPSFTARRNIIDLNNQIDGEMNKRDDADSHSLSKAELVAASVGGDPAFGKNSSLFESFGFVRKSERKTGLTRKAGSSTPTAPSK